MSNNETPEPNAECRICETPIFNPAPWTWASVDYCENHDPSDEPDHDERIGFEASMERKYPLIQPRW